MKTCIIVNFWANTDDKVDIAVEAINQLKKSGKDIVYTSLTPVHPRIQEVCTFCIYSDTNQLITYQEVLDSDITILPTYQRSVGDICVRGRPVNFDDVTFSILDQLRVNLLYLKELGYDAFHYFLGDCILLDKDVDLLNSFDTVLEKTNKKAYFENLRPKNFEGYQTVYFYSHIDFYLQVVPSYTRETWIEERTRTSGICLEEVYLMYFSKYPEDVLITKQDTPYIVKVDLFRDSNDTLDMVTTEAKNSYFVAWNNESEEFEMVIVAGHSDVARVVSNNLDMTFHLEKSVWYRQGLGNAPFRLQVSSNSDNFVLDITEKNAQKLRYSCFLTSDDYNFAVRKKNRKKIKLVHIQTTNNDEREQRSRASLERVKEYGWEYVLHQNQPYKSLPPAHTCLRPQCVSMQLFDSETANKLGTALTPAHYGCFEAFKLAVLTEFYDCDYLMICEGDCLIETDLKAFITVVEDSIPIMYENNIGYMSFGDKALLESGILQSHVVEEIPKQDLLYITNSIIGIQCIMFPASTSSYLKEQFRTHPWDTADYFFNMVFGKSQWKMGILKKRITTQLDGFSLIDQAEKTFTK